MPSKYFFVIVFLFGMSMSSNAQTYFSKIHDIDNHSTENGLDILEYEGRNFVAMRSRCDSFTVNCATISEIDSQGEIVWSHILPDMSISKDAPLLIKSDTLYVLGFHVADDSLFFKRNYLVKLSLDGNSLGVVEYFPESAVERMVPYGIAEIQTDGSILTYGEIISLDEEEIVAFFMKTNSQGVLDTILLFNEGDISNRMSDCRLDESGNIWLMNAVGEWYVAGGGGTFRRRKLWTYKLNSEFELIDSYQTPGLSYTPTMEYGFEPTADGGFVMISEESINDSGDPEIWKLDANMELEWKLELFTFPRPWPRLFDLKLTKDGDILVCGFIKGLSIAFEGSNNFGYVAKVSSSGELLWDRYFEYDPYLDYDMDANFFKLRALEDGSILTIGRAYRYFIQDDGEERLDIDVWVAKLDEDGCVYDDCPYVSDLYVGVDTPLENELEINIYPNPTTATITLSGIDEFVFENYSLYNTLGNQVYFSTEFQNTLDLSHLPKGIYYLQVGLEEGVSRARRVIVQ